MDREVFKIKEKEAALYKAETENAPLIVLNTFTGEGAAVFAAMRELSCPACNLLEVGNLDWDHDMSPWDAPPLFPKDTPRTGGADEYLDLLLNEIIPEARKRINGEPSFTGIAGYSLAGLFALYAVYRTDVFDRVASMSGSLWFPDFREYVLSHDMRKRPDTIYISLGDAEAKTRNPVLKTVQKNTEEITEYYRSLGMDVTYELNPGNHFRDPELRSAKGILAILREVGTWDQT
jgi:predicted alpha/beta superfamily hydrolase